MKSTTRTIVLLLPITIFTAFSLAQANEAPKRFSPESIAYCQDAASMLSSKPAPFDKKVGDEIKFAFQISERKSDGSLWITVQPHPYKDYKMIILNAPEYYKPPISLMILYYGKALFVQ